MGAPPAAGGAGMGPAPAAPAGPASTSVQNISAFGGKVLKRDKREKILKQKERINRQWQRQQSTQDISQGTQQDSGTGWQRDDKGRIMLTGPERELMSELIKLRKNNTIQYSIYPQFEVKHGSQTYSIDFALPNIKLGIEVDGYLFHSSSEQKQKDKERDAKLASQGWTMIRFTDDELDSKMRQVTESIIYYIKLKEKEISQQNKPEEQKKPEK
jgi:very-short-patch-repair endonuclease